jgi:hypothetical protein
MGSMFRVSCKWEIGSRSGIITDDSEIPRPHKWKFEVVGGTCGTADRGGLSQNGSDEKFVEGLLVGMCEP